VRDVTDPDLPPPRIGGDGMTHGAFDCAAVPRFGEMADECDLFQGVLGLVVMEG
jgi:hypothetical protein